MPMNIASQIASIKEALRKKGIEPDTVDVAALVDSTLEYGENLKNIMLIVGKQIGKGEQAFESGKEEFIEDELKRLGETGEMIIEHIQDLKARLEETKRKLAEKRRKAKKKIAKPLTTLPLPQPSAPISEAPVTELCKQSPLDREEKQKIVNAVAVHDIDAAVKVIKECKTLDESDKFELEEMLRFKKMELSPVKEVAKPTRERRVVTAREVMREKEAKEKEVLPFKAVEYEYHDINLQNAKLFLRDYQQYLPGMLRLGLLKWLETRRAAFKFPLSSHNIDSLASALQYSIVQPEQKSVRNTTAVQFVSKHAPDILVRGMDKASESFAWGTVYSYYKDTLKKDMPPIDKFKQDVIRAAMGIQFSFD